MLYFSGIFAQIWFLALLKDGLCNSYSGGELSLRQITAVNEKNFVNVQWELTFKSAWQLSERGNQVCLSSSELESIYRLTNVLSCKECQKLKSQTFNYFCTNSTIASKMVIVEETVRLTGASATKISAWLTGCCLVTLINGASSWRISVDMDLNAIVKAGKQINTSPRSGAPFVIPVLQECRQEVDLRVIDDDGDKVRCRWALGNVECGGLCKRPDGIELDGDRCTLIVNQPKTAGLYGVAVIIEDYPTTEDKKPLSTSALQLLINVLPHQGVCSKRPTFDSPVPAGGSSVNVAVNKLWTETIMASVADSEEGIKEFVFRAPAGVVISPPTRSKTAPLQYHANITWTPTEEDKEKEHSLCLVAVTTKSIPSELRCISLVTRDMNLTSTVAPTQQGVPCLAVVTGKDSSSRGILSWPTTLAGSVAEFPCPFGPSGALAYRTCSRTLLGVWEPVKSNECAFGKQTTLSLEDLAKNPVNNTNVKEVTKTIAKISNSSEALTAEDTTFISEIVEKIVATDSVDEEVSNLLLQTTSNVMNSNGAALLSAQVDSGSLSKLVKSIAMVTQKVPLSNDNGVPVTHAAADVALQAVVFSTNTFTGAQFAVDNLNSSGGSFQTSSLRLKAKLNTSQNLDLLVDLPSSLLRDIPSNGSTRSRLGFVVYKDARLFKSVTMEPTGIHKETNDIKTVTVVVAIETGQQASIPLSNPVRMTFRTTQDLQRKNARCGFWNFTANAGLGAWSSQGCHLAAVEVGQVTCSCDHLTNFAVLFDPLAASSVDTLSVKHTQVLGTITFIGIGLSLLGLFLTLLTFALFRQLREGSHAQITLQLCFSLFLTLVLFVATIKLDLEGNECKTVAVFLHYFLLVTFMWMLMQAIDLYLKFVQVLGSYVKGMVIRAALLAWVLPAVLVAISAGVRWNDYGHPTACVVFSYAAYGFLFAPILLIIFINLMVFIFVLKSVVFRKNLGKSETEDGFMLHFQFAIMCCFLLGLTWLFGAFAVGSARLTFQYLFCLFNALQGFFIFYFQVLRKKNVRVLWFGFLTGKGRHRSPSSLYSSSQIVTARTKSRKSDASGNSIQGQDLTKIENGGHKISYANGSPSQKPITM